MKRNIIKATLLSAVAAVLVFAPASQAFAGSHHGYGGDYGGGHHYGEHNYYQAPQSYIPAPQNYTVPQSTQPQAQSDSNDFDPTIYDIQVVLFDQGYYEGELDGLYGPATKAALLSFQSNNNIPESEDADVEALKADLTTLEALGLYTLL